MNAEESDFLQALIRHEAVVGTLYQAFSEMFPAREEFFGALAMEEQRHAERLGELSSDPAINGWLLGESGLRLQAIRSSIGYVESQIDRTQRGGLTLLQALPVAAGFGALISSSFPALSDFGIVIVVDVVFALIVTVTVVPALVRWLDRDKTRSQASPQERDREPATSHEG